MSETVILLLSLAAMMALGIVMTRFCNLVHLPNVTAYLLAGLILSPYTFGIVKEDLLSSFSLLTEIALGFIAFSIGFCFKVSHLKTLGKGVFIITVVQAVSTAILVDLAMLVLYFCGVIDLPVVFVMGAIATATAPAATLLVVHQYNAKGPVTDTLLPVVAIDDAIGLMIFSISLAVSQTLANGTEFSAIVLLEPLKEIGLSLVIGAALGFVVSGGVKIFRSRANRLTIIILCIFVGVALSKWLNLSSLLLCMMIGAIYCNFDIHTEPVMDSYDRWAHPLYVLFFVISGAQLNVRILLSVGVVGVVYLVSRALGKYSGAALGATLAKSEPNVKKYLGLTLLPQAGVAIGMAQEVISDLPSYASVITTVVLSATLVYELIGPLLTKMALEKAGEIVIPPKKNTKTENTK